MRESVNAKMNSRMRKLSIEIAKLGLRIRTPTPTNSDSEAVGSGDESLEDSPSPRQRCNGKKQAHAEMHQDADYDQKSVSNPADNKSYDHIRAASAKSERPRLSRRSRSDMGKYSTLPTRNMRDSPRSQRKETNIPEDENRNKDVEEQSPPMAKCAPLVRPGLRRKSRSDLAKYGTVSKMEGISGVSGKSMSDDDLQRVPPVYEAAGRATLPKIRYQVAPAQQTDRSEKQKRFKARRSKSFTSLLGGRNKSKESSESGAGTEKKLTFARRRSFSGKQERKRGDKEGDSAASSQSNSPTRLPHDHAKPINNSRYREALSAGLVPGLVRIQRPSRKSWTYEDILGGTQNPLFLGLSTRFVEDGVQGGARSGGSMMETDLCSTEL